MPADQPSHGTDMSRLCARLLSIRDYEAVVSLALIMLSESRKTGSAELQASSHNVLREAIIGITGLEQPRSEMACSFCGKGKDETRLVAGMRGCICAECASIALEVIALSSRTNDRT